MTNFDVVPVLDIKSALVSEMDLYDKGEPCFWVWEAKDTSIVLGAGCKAEKELRLDNIAVDGISYYKRRSGGGTVVLGRGVLCFGFLLKNEWGLCRPKIASGYALPFIIEAFKGLGADIEVKGLGDLAKGEKKICGTAQKWCKKSVLFHGSILIDFDIELIEKYLSHPPLEPDYRKGRPHTDFCTTVSAVCGRTITTAKAAQAIVKVVKGRAGLPVCSL
jgi:lipoate-protein ligase A